MKAKLAAFAILALLATACKEQDEFPDPVFENSYLHIVSGSNQVDTFSLVFDYYNVDDVVITDFFQMKSWPSVGYAELTAGGEPDDFGNGLLYLHAIKYFSPSPTENDTLVNHKSIILAAEEKSTLCFADSSGEMIALKYTDTYTNAPDGMVNIRLINLMQTLGSATLRSSDGTVSINGVDFREASQFIQVPAAIYNIEVVDESNSVVVNTMPNSGFWSRGTFTIVIGTGGAITRFEN